MNWRIAAAFAASLAVAACGGGGSGATEGAGAPAVTADPGPAPTPVTATAPAPVTAFAATPNIAMWGDSLTPGIARAFTYMWDTPRQIFDAGIAGQTSVQIVARETADTDHRDWLTTFWYGHNNVTQPEQIKADIAASVAHLAPGNNRFIVLSVLNEGNGLEGRGSPTYNTIMQLNSELAATYPQNYLDIRSFMVSQFDPNNPQQVEEFQRDEPSSSLRFDAIHLTGSGAEVVGRKIIAFIQSKGW